MDRVSIAAHFKIRSPIGAEKSDGKRAATGGASSSGEMRVSSGGKTQRPGGALLISANPRLRQAVFLSKGCKEETWVAPDDKGLRDLIKLGMRMQAKVPDTGSAGTTRVESFGSQPLTKRWHFQSKDQTSGVAGLPLSAQVHPAVYDEKRSVARPDDHAALHHPDDSAPMPKSYGNGIPGGIIPGVQLTAKDFVEKSVRLEARLHVGKDKGLCDVQFVGLETIRGTSAILVSLTNATSNKKALAVAINSHLMQPFDDGGSRLSKLFNREPALYVLDPAKGFVTLHSLDESVPAARLE